MPAYADLVSNKRKADDSYDQYNAKRQAAESSGAGSSNGGSWESYWMVQWRNKQTKKHKTWDGDAVLLVRRGYAELVGMDSNRMSSGTLKVTISEGLEFEMGGKTIEVERRLPREEYMSGTCFGRGPIMSSTSTTTSSSSSGLHKKYVPLKPVHLNPTTPARPSSSSMLGRTYPAAPSQSPYSPPKSAHADSYWTANWRRPQNKKHKTWDGDGYVVFSQGILKLVSETGKILGQAKWKGTPLSSGYYDRIGPREVELDAQISASQMPKIVGTSEDANVPDNDEWEVPTPRVHALTPSTPAPASPALANTSLSAKKFVMPAVSSFYSKAPPKPKANGPLHDPEADNAIIMKAPTKDHIRKFNKKELPIVPVVIDPILARKLRPHQVEGVKFLYECVMGLRKHEGQGCILADEMGLGKTLQTIVLVWTLLKQNCYVGAGPVIGKALIVCPVSLVNNWKNEFRKWLGRDRVGVFDGTKAKNAVKQFINSRIHQVLIIGYEKLRSIISELAYCQPPIGLIICDEGHRLKSANNKTSKMFEALRTPRRVILSGTPIQNDLSEFHAMADFCNPGLLDTYPAFKKIYETPILQSRAPGCTKKEAELGEARLEQLGAVARSFVLRREATILKNYLPPKTEYVVFITPTETQLNMFAKMLANDQLDDLVSGSTADSLALINHLTKISSSPILLKAKSDSIQHKANATTQDRLIMEAAKLLPSNLQIYDVSLSGKLTALASLLKVLRRDTDEKCIIVSHFTATLNVVQEYCERRGYTYHRLDGKTPPAKRQDYVNEFNKASQASRFVFLLSSKAGGVGLNLIGASRLVLFDSDWNPSHDLQSMARIHRDGQKRPVFIYRFLTAGTIDEKVFQRQVTKMGLSDSLMNAGAGASKSDSFSRKDLRDIFRVHPDTACHTHELLDCPCDASGAVDVQAVAATLAKVSTSDTEDEFDDGERELVRTFRAASQLRPDDIEKMDKDYIKKKKGELASLGQWKHINCLLRAAPDNVKDQVLRKLLHAPPVVMKQGKPQKSLSLLDAVDMASELSLEDELQEMSLKDLPGGSISFLFEKGAQAKVDGEEGDEDDGEGGGQGDGEGGEGGEADDDEGVESEGS